LGTLHEYQYTFMIISRSFLLEWEIFQTEVVQKIKTHILCSIAFFRKSFRLWDNVEKFCRTGQATDDNMPHAHFTLVTQSYKQTHRIYSTYCFSAATMVARTCHIITLYLHCQPCWMLYLTVHKVTTQRQKFNFTVQKYYRIFSKLIRTPFTVSEGLKIRCGLESRAD